MWRNELVGQNLRCYKPKRHSREARTRVDPEGRYCCFAKLLFCQTAGIEHWFCQTASHIGPDILERQHKERWYTVVLLEQYYDGDFYERCDNHPSTVSQSPCHKPNTERHDSGLDTLWQKCPRSSHDITKATPIPQYTIVRATESNTLLLREILMSCPHRGSLSYFSPVACV